MNQVKRCSHLLSHLFLLVLFSTSFSHPRTTKSHSSAICSRWRTAWSSGGPRSCLERSPRMNWPSSRRRSQPKSIMETGKPGMTFTENLERDEHVPAKDTAPHALLILQLANNNAYCSPFLRWKTFNFVEKNLAVPFLGQILCWISDLKEMTEEQRRWGLDPNDSTAKQTERDWASEANIFGDLGQSLFLF